ncbi:MAG: molybdopterin converting factor subunit 1 [Sphingopyxis macrogoltabida]|uniref:Molybdopterin converting factor subunit 1 n=1 Tax=Sphingopyxis macrogoltabida TaxID=33050 RepID=A0A2W5KWN2_SPHMC|nr:MAG: molybdopterin converting factor subunit 1 [Sphingopyxis macrogoltabida]
MQLRIVYFAWVREAMGVADELADIPRDVASVGSLIGWLAARDERGAAAFGDPSRIRAAIDGTLAPADAPLAGVGEVALFPPVTGG